MALTFRREEIVKENALTLSAIDSDLSITVLIPMARLFTSLGEQSHLLPYR